MPTSGMRLAVHANQLYCNTTPHKFIAYPCFVQASGYCLGCSAIYGKLLTRRLAKGPPFCTIVFGSLALVGQFSQLWPLACTLRAISVLQIIGGHLRGLVVLWFFGMWRPMRRAPHTQSSRSVKATQELIISLGDC